ncbi:unnamed protein product [Onchocerca ochengi]|uniref:Uncharacterized protein n=1 Tax=Onchocerca ochengi TaxID=42157 RepID=A0A182EP07_ONCOC|nr:unnamed protein product [Onchocerca ochengi]VDM93538.1 unnamed protein product [Onchocerca ochengi]
MECASQKKPTHEITNSMRSMAPPMMPPTSITPAYAKDSPVAPHPSRQTPNDTVPVEISPSTELKLNTKKNIVTDNMEPEGLPEKEKDGGIRNGKAAGGDGNGGVDYHDGGIGSDFAEKSGKGDLNGFNECPDLTPDILKNILDNEY